MKQFWSKSLACLLCLALLVGMLPVAALAEDNPPAPANDGISLLADSISYIDDKGITQTRDSATEVTGSDTTWGADDNVEHWYVVNSTLTIDGRIEVTGDVHLILANGYTLNAAKGINVTGTNRLTIYGQSGGTGKLTATGGSQQAGIGGNYGQSGGTITINGGTVNATGGSSSAGIGGGDSGAGGGTITIRGGTVIATGQAGAGIGGGWYGAGGTITINGGTVTANGGNYSAGIGGGNSSAGGTITITGGMVTATGGTNGAAGIGGGPQGAGGTITITGGTVIAEGSWYADGIGSGISQHGTFSTGEDGHAVIITNGISDESNKDSWDGVIFDRDSHNGQVYGSNVTPTEDFEIPEGYTLTIDDSKTLTIPADVTLTVNGEIRNNGKLDIQGIITGTGSITPKFKQTVSAPPTASVSQVTDTTLTIETGTKPDDAIGDVEYGYTTGVETEVPAARWSSNSTFSDLTSATKYTIYVRYSGNGFYEPVVSTGVEVYTAHSAPGEGVGYTINYADETVTANSGYEVKLSNSNDWITSGTSLTITPGSTFQVRHGKTADGAPASEPLTVNVEARPAVPTFAIDNEDEGVTIPSGYSYNTTSEDYSNTWTPGDGSLVKIEPGNSIYIYKAATESTFKSAVQTLAAPERASAPTLPTINYEDEALSSTTTAMEYRVGDTGEWGKCTADMSLVDIGWTGTEMTVYFRTAATDANYASNPTAGLTIPARPAAPNVQGVNETVAGRNDGRITGLTAGTAYEISSDDGQSWQDAELTGTEVTGLAPGTYQVRLKGMASSFIGAAANVTIATGAAPTYALNVTAPTFENVYTGYTQPEAKAITITSSGNSDATISNVTVDNASFTIGGSGSTVPAGGSISTWTIQPAASLVVGTHTATITVTYDSGATATAQVSFTVTQRPSSGGGGGSSRPTYPPTMDEPENGAVTTSPSRPEEGDAVTITPKPDEGFEVDEILVKDENGEEIKVTQNPDGTYTFTQPDGKVTITVTFRCDGGELCPGHHLTDVSKDAWYHAAVDYAVERGIMEGMSATTFSPTTEVTRAQAVQILYNLEGKPDISDENLGYPYEDVNAQAWYGDAVYWARITGVATGYGDGTFQPADSITRQEFAQMLYNYAKYKGYDLTAEGDLSQFPDNGSVADWAEAAMSWANGNELINGHDDGTIDAGGTAIRAQAASFLMRFDQNLVKN